MKAVDVFKNQRDQNNGQDERHGASGVFQYNMRDDIADVAATIDDFFEKLVKVFHHDDLDGIVFATVKVPVMVHHGFVRFAFEILQFVVQRFQLVKIGAFAEDFDHGGDEVGGLLQQGDLLGKVQVFQILRSQHDALAQFLNRLGNAIKRIGKILDVFAFKRG